MNVDNGDKNTMTSLKDTFFLLITLYEGNPQVTCIFSYKARALF